MSKLPKSLQRFFWDVTPADVDFKKQQDYVINRILEYGDPAALRWLFQAFPKNAIVETIKKSRQLSVKSVNFWVGFLNIDKSQVRCLQPQSQRNSQKIWPY